MSGKISESVNLPFENEIPVLKDKDIREPLFDFLEEHYGKIRILEEKTMGRSRADIVMVMPEKLVGIEIKSDADTYTRLARQVRDYDKYFDANILVVGSSHALHAAEHVPDTWGIISVEIIDNLFDFYVVREMQANPHVDLARKIRILWRPELHSIQQRYHLPEYKQKSKTFVQKKLVEKLPEMILNEQISQELFERDYTQIAEEIRNYKRENSRVRRRRK